MGRVLGTNFRLSEKRSVKVHASGVKDRTIAATGSFAVAASAGAAARFLGGISHVFQKVDQCRFSL
jgi:hypothetical protein